MQIFKPAMAKSLNEIGMLRPLKYKFYIKGLKLEPAEAANPIAQISLPYFKEKETFTLVAPPLSKIAPALEELFGMIETGNKAVIVNRDYLESDSFSDAFLKDFCIDSTDISKLSSLEIAVFYNTLPALVPDGCHTSLFVEYSMAKELFPDINLFSADGHCDFKQVAGLIAEQAFKEQSDQSTVICMHQESRTVKFAFTTSEELKEIAIDQLCCPENTLVYSKKPLKYDIKNCSWVSSIKSLANCRCFVFADISSIELIESVVERVANVIITYTKEDFSRLEAVKNAFDKKNISVPDAVNRIIEKCRNQADLAMESNSSAK